MKRNTLYILRLSGLALSLALLMFPSVSALSAQEKSIISSGIHYFDVDAGSASACTPTGSGTTTPVEASAAQKANAMTVIGIAKTDGVGKNGALIGLMVALDESGLRVLANENVPLSESNPNKQGDGSDGTSLGVFQQQITTDWSTISSDINNQAAINQLMNAAYNAEAFFGSPPDSNAPAQLSKGLLNHGKWSSLDPWVAAQAVQASGTPDGSNYKAFQGKAQSLIDQYYDSAPPVPLPVPFTGGTGTDTSASSTDCSADGTTIASKAAPAYCQAGGTATGSEKVVCSAWLFDGYGYSTPGLRGNKEFLKTFMADVKNCVTNKYSTSSGCKYPQGKLLVDCSGMVDAAIYDGLGIDMGGISTSSYPSSSHLQSIPLAQAQPGDIAWWNDNGVADGHTEVIVSYDHDSDRFTTFGAHMDYGNVSKDIGPASYPGSGGGWAVQKVYRVVP